WETIRQIRRVITGALERERKEKRIGSSLQAAPVVYVTPELATVLDGVDLAELAITSGIRVETGDGPPDAFRLPEVPGVAVVPRPATGRKCARCWQILESVDAADELCPRCREAVARLAA
ncbi:MAG TPA: isoleucine--tRNA ligase, partial [Rhodospirillales bacterium]|nr:isoleucine--tRNA ligase [Rhodospirillales bacterium]